MKERLASPEGVPAREAKRAQSAPIAAGSDVAEVALPATAIAWHEKAKGSASLAVFAVIVAFTLVGFTRSDQFYNYLTWSNILTTGSFTGIVACFEGLLMIGGGLDLSVGSAFLAGVMSGTALSYHGWNDFVAFGAAAGIGAGIGLVNGLIVNYGHIASFITTLGTMFAIEAIVVTLTGGQPIGPLSASFTRVGDGSIGPVPIMLLYMVGIALCAHVVLEYTTLGTQIRAIGGNREAASATGVNTQRLSTILYVLCGLFAALAGVLQASYLGAGDPTLGASLNLQAIAAAIIGGVSMYGSIGTVIGIVLGSVLLSVLTTGLILMRINPGMQDFVVGVVLIMAAGADRMRRQRMIRVSRARQIEIDEGAAT